MHLVLLNRVLFQFTFFYLLVSEVPLGVSEQLERLTNFFFVEEQRVESSTKGMDFWLADL